MLQSGNRAVAASRGAQNEGNEPSEAACEDHSGPGSLFYYIDVNVLLLITLLVKVIRNYIREP